MLHTKASWNAMEKNDLKKETIAQPKNNKTISSAHIM